jgi:hypothetical protein
VGSLEEPRPFSCLSVIQVSHMAYPSTLKMEAVGSSETLVHVCHIAWYVSPVDSILHSGLLWFFNIYDFHEHWTVAILCIRNSNLVDSFGT